MVTRAEDLAIEPAILFSKYFEVVAHLPLFRLRVTRLARKESDAAELTDESAVADMDAVANCDHTARDFDFLAVRPH